MISTFFSLISFSFQACILCLVFYYWRNISHGRRKPFMQRTSQHVLKIQDCVSYLREKRLKTEVCFEKTSWREVYSSLHSNGLYCLLAPKKSVKDQLMFLSLNETQELVVQRVAYEKLSVSLKGSCSLCTLLLLSFHRHLCKYLPNNNTVYRVHFLILDT